MAAFIILILSHLTSSHGICISFHCVRTVRCGATQFAVAATYQNEVYLALSCSNAFRWRVEHWVGTVHFSPVQYTDEMRSDAIDETRRVNDPSVCICLSGLSHISLTYRTPIITTAKKQFCTLIVDGSLCCDFSSYTIDDFWRNRSSQRHHTNVLSFVSDYRY